MDYQKLERMASYLHAHNVDLLIVQSPIRAGAMQYLDEQTLIKHIEILEDIAERNNQTFINMTDIVWPDSLYVNNYHFNAKGSNIYTTEVIRRLKKEKH